MEKDQNNEVHHQTGGMGRQSDTNIEAKGWADSERSKAPTGAREIHAFSGENPKTILTESLEAVIGYAYIGMRYGTASRKFEPTMLQARNMP